MTVGLVFLDQSYLTNLCNQVGHSTGIPYRIDNRSKANLSATMKLFIPSIAIGGYALASRLFGLAEGTNIINTNTVQPNSSFTDRLVHKKTLTPEFIPFVKGKPSDIRSLSRRSLKADSSIVTALIEELDAGIQNPRFTLTANHDSEANLFASTEPFQVNVVMTNPSVTEDTSFSINGGESKPVGPSPIRYLIADPEAQDGAPNQFAILAVNIDDGTVRGLVRQGKTTVSLSQDVGGPATVSDASHTPSKDWKCFADEMNTDHRFLSEEHKNKNHHHEHEHEHHDDGHEHHDDGHEHKFPDLEDIAAQLGVKVDLQKNRRRMTYKTDDFPLKWSYQVDLYIEVDTAMIDARDPNDTVNIPNTIAYINALITTISAIYEKEVDTHCK